MPVRGRGETHPRTGKIFAPVPIGGPARIGRVTDVPQEPTSADPPSYPGVVVGPPARRLVGSIVAAVVVAVVIAVSGAGVGWLWAELAPRVAVIKAEQGFLYADSEPEQAVAGDGWFTILGVLAGLLFAVAVWYVLRRYRGPLMVVALAVGSLAGAALAWWVGYKIGLDQFNQVRGAAIGSRLDAPLGLRITNLSKDHLWTRVPNGVAAVQALVAVAVYSVFAGMSAYGDLRRDPLPVYQPLAYPSAFPPPSYQPSAYQPPAYQPPTYQPPAYGPSGTDQQSGGAGQFGPGLTGNSDSATGTART